MRCSRDGSTSTDVDDGEGSGSWVMLSVADTGKKGEEDKVQGDRTGIGFRNRIGVEAERSKNGIGSVRNLTRATVAATMAATITKKARATTTAVAWGMRKQKTTMLRTSGGPTMPSLTASRTAPSIPCLPTVMADSGFEANLGMGSYLGSVPDVGSGSSVSAAPEVGLGSDSSSGMSVMDVGTSMLGTVPGMSSANSPPGSPPPGYRRQRAEGHRLRRVELPPVRS